MGVDLCSSVSASVIVRGDGHCQRVLLRVYKTHAHAHAHAHTHTHMCTHLGGDTK